MKRVTALLVVLLGGAPLVGPDAAAQGLRRRDSVHPTRVASLREKSRSEFGTSSDTVLSISSAAFSENDRADDVFIKGVYFGESGFSSCNFSCTASAPVTLPAGVVIDAVEWVGCAVNPSGDFDIYLYADHGAETSRDTIAAFTTTSGCGYQVLDLSYPTAGNLDSYYRFEVHQNPANVDNLNFQFRGVNVWYHRTVSPPPASPSFADVPTSDFGFQYIEALLASGITGGCGGGIYCPDSPVTRRQMAIFLSKALGLHWPN